MQAQNYSAGYEVVSIVDMGGVGDNASDNSAALAAAVAALPSGGTIYFPIGIYRFSQPWNLDQRFLLRIIGAGANQPGAGAATKLIYTGSGSASAISLRAARGIKFEGLYLSYNNAGFTGYLLDCGKSPNTSGDTVNIVLEDCNVRADNDTLSGGAALLFLGWTTGFRACRTGFRGAQFNVIGTTIPAGLPNSFNDTIIFDECIFAYASVCAVKNAGSNWAFVNACTFEPIASGGAGAYLCDPGAQSISVAFRDCWMGDDSNSVPGTWINWSAGNNLTVQNCSIGIGAHTTALLISGNSLGGIMVNGNNFFGGGGSSTAVNFGTSSGVYGFSSFSCTFQNVTAHVIGNIPPDSIYQVDSALNIGALGCASLAVSGPILANKLSITGAPTQPNMMTAIQADFETSGTVTGWLPNNSAVVPFVTTTQAALHGSRCLVVTATGGVQKEVSINSRSGMVTAGPGQSWTGLASFLLPPGGTPRNVTVALYSYNGTLGSQIAASGGTTRDNVSTWITQSATGTTLGDCVAVYLTIRWTDSVNMTPGESHWLDCVSLSRSSSTNWQDPAEPYSLITILGDTIQQQGINGEDSLYLLAQNAGVVHVNQGPQAGTGGVELGGHAYFPDGAPTLTAGTGAGTGPTLALTGSDTAGMITVTTGTGCAASAKVVTLNFGIVQLNVPAGISLTPANQAARALGGNGVWENAATRTINGFDLYAGQLADGATYIWNYGVPL
jgi:hypothetical protein